MREQAAVPRARVAPPMARLQRRHLPVMGLAAARRMLYAVPRTSVSVQCNSPPTADLLGSLGPPPTSLANELAQRRPRAAVAQHGGARSPDFSGGMGRAQRPFSTRPRILAVVRPGPPGVAGRLLRLQLQRRTGRSARSNRCPLEPGNSVEPAGARTVFQPMWGSTGRSARSTVPGHCPQPSVRSPVRPELRRDPCPRRCQHRAAPASAGPISSRAGRPQALHAGATRHPGHDQAVASSARPRPSHPHVGTTRCNAARPNAGCEP